jgi:hypothetical protein
LLAAPERSISTNPVMDVRPSRFREHSRVEGDGRRAVQEARFLTPDAP